MRLIDADNLGVKKLSDFRETTTFAYGWNSALNAVKNDSQSVDPETMPIVRELREKLKRVTAERDAAIKDRAELAGFELTVCEQFCFGDRKHNIPPCEWNRFGRCKLREWSVPVAENATTDTST